MEIRAHGLVVSVPDLWEMASLVLLGPAEEQKPHGPTLTPGTAFSPNAVLSVDPLPRGLSLDKFVASQLLTMAKAGALAEATPPMALKRNVEGASAGVEVELVIQGPRGQRIRQKHIYAQRANRVVSMVVSHLDGQPFEAFRAEAERILASFALV